MRKSFKIPLITAGLLTSTALAGLATQRVGNDLANAVVARAIAQIPGARVAAIHADPWTGKVALEGLAIDNGNNHIHIGRLAFSRPPLLTGFVAPAFAADGTATASGVVVDFAPFKFTFDTISATGTSLSDADLADLFSATSTTPIADRVAKLSAATIKVPNVREDFSFQNLTGHVTYQNVELDNAVNGKIATAVAASTVLNAQASAPTPQTIDATYGAMQITNLDLPQLIHVLTGPRTDPDEALKPIYDNFTVDSTTMDSMPVGKEKGGATIGKMVGQGVAARPLKTSFAAIGALMSELNAKDKPSPDQVKALLAFIDDVLTSFSFGSIDANDMRFMSTGTPDSADVQIKHIGLSGWQAGKIDSISYDGFVVAAANDVKATLGSFALHGLDFTTTLAALQKLEAEDDPDIANVDPRAFLPTLGQIVFSGLDFDVPDKGHKGNAANGARDVFKLGKFEVDMSHYLNGIPTAIAAVLDGFSMPLPHTIDFKPIADLGYSVLGVSANLDIAWDKATQQIAVKQSASADGMGSVRLATTIGNVTDELFSSDVPTMEAAAFGVLWKDLDLFVQNDGLFEKILANQAKVQKTSVETVRSGLIAVAGVGIPAALDNVPAARTIATAVTKFIAQPKTLHIHASSPEGLGAGDAAQLGKPGDLLRKVDVTAVADE